MAAKSQNPTGMPLRSDPTFGEFRRRDFLIGAVVGGAALSLSGFSTARADETPAPKRGGRLRVGMFGGGASETLDPNLSNTDIDIARAHVLFERLVDFNPDGSLFNQLAEEFSPSADGSNWKIKLRSGVLWHDGSPFQAQDVVYTLRYVLDPANKAQGGADIAFVKPQNIRALDALTVEIVPEQPIAVLPTSLSSRALYIFKDGTKSFDAPIGTGPFAFKSFKRGERSLFVRNQHYRVPNRPYLDELEIISINDATTRLNALLGGQVDAMSNVDFKLIPAVKANPKVKLLIADSGTYPGQVMQTDTFPFNDNRVRQAFRLMINRKEIIDVALGGFGKIGNDLACPFDPDYAKELPQHAYDPDKAKFLIKQAGREGVTTSLYTGDIGPGMIESSTLMAQYAAKVGITLKLDKAPAETYYTDKFMKVPFQCTDWGQRPLDSQIAQAFNHGAPYNESHWERPDFDRLTNEARRTLDPKKRHELWVAAQKMLWDEGGYIIWGFPQLIDAHAANVYGLTPSSARPLGWFTFTDVYFG
jgi:peptide/nickel transport system substrate-binding protein